MASRRNELESDTGHASELNEAVFIRTRTQKQTEYRPEKYPVAD